ncbi:MAG TPA: DUF6516 family protein [Syntrophorhabdales bacterium]|jgi:hypothetical protein|nr:DUF6516 family protein [Syntrophorhabdales bacterium]
MTSILVLHTKEVRGNEIVEIKVWQVPRSKAVPHGVKYSIAYIRDGTRLLGYDNAEGKGHHRHYRGREEPYDYLDIWRTIADFKKDLIDMRGSDWDEDQKNNH